MRAWLVVFYAVLQLCETTKRVSVSVFNDSPTPVSVHFVHPVIGKTSMVLPEIAAGGRRNMDSFEHHRFQIQPTIKAKYGPGEWVNPPGLRKVFVTARVIGQVLDIEVGCQGSNGKPGKCNADAGKQYSDDALHDAIALTGGATKKVRDNTAKIDTATPQLLFHNLGKTALDVFWMNVNKRFLNIKGLQPSASSHVGTHTGHVFKVVRQGEGASQGSCTIRAGHFNQDWTIRDGPEESLECKPDLPSPFRLALHNQLSQGIRYSQAFTNRRGAAEVDADAKEELAPGGDVVLRLVEGETLRWVGGGYGERRFF